MSDNVVKFNEVPPRQVSEHYRGYQITYKFDPNVRRWSWAFDHVTRIPFNGDSSDIEKAKRDAHRHIDSLVE